MGDERGVTSSDQSGYYPTSQMPLAGQLPDSRRIFNELREQFLLGYTFQTARAYWSDLEQIADWAEERGKDVLANGDESRRLDKATTARPDQGLARSAPRCSGRCRCF